MRSKGLVVVKEWNSVPSLLRKGLRFICVTDIQKEIDVEIPLELNNTLQYQSNGISSN